MRAVVVNCTLKPSPEPSNTDAPAEVVAGWSHKTGRAMASNLYAVAKTLSARPVPAPPQ
ncbi:hypothetical protein [Nonomuraea fuscirosea]|uniref:hypothetical protein n=1 Tax=Nonomuraea fuscirosea TaxID=1291556 RepID=UPI00341BA5BE